MRTCIYTCYIGFCLLIALTIADAGDDKETASRPFFKSTPSETLASVMNYLVASQPEASIQINQNSNVVYVFTWWISKLFDPSCVPSEDFVVQNLRLHPANKEHPDDVASLVFRVGTTNLQVIQTGGFDGRFCILAETGKAEATDTNSARTVIESTLTAILRIDGATRIGGISLIPTNGGFLGVGGLGKSPFKCLTNGKEVFVSIPKADLQETLPAREPLSNEWFDWERGLAPRRKSK